MLETEALDEVVGNLADGVGIDWSAIETMELGPGAELLGAIRGLERVAEAHHDIHGIPEDMSKWGPLELGELLGKGAFGHVYRAIDPALHRQVALKLLHPDAELTGHPLHEAQLLARIRHDNVAAVYGADREGGRVGFWMELIEGQTLAELVQEQGPFAAREAALIGIELCRALAAVHGQGIVHRDVKAQNVIRETGGRLVLTDFGIGLDRQHGTEPADISGTPLYLAPEILDGDHATARSDLYALGVLLFYLVTDRFPVEADSLNELRDCHHQGNTLHLRDLRADLPASFIEVVETALRKEPSRRFSSAGEMERALLSFWSPEYGTRSSKQRLSLPWMAAGVVLVLMIGSWLQSSPPTFWPPAGSGERNPADPRRAPADAEAQARPTKALIEWENATEDPRFDSIVWLEEALLAHGFEAATEREIEMARQRCADLAKTPSGLALCSRAEVVLIGRMDRTEKGEYEIRLSARDSRSDSFLKGVNRLEVTENESQKLDRAARELINAMKVRLDDFPRGFDLRPATTSSREALLAYSEAVSIYEGKNQIGVAISKLNNAVQHDAEFASAYSWLARLHSARGEFETALEHSRRAYELSETLSTRLPVDEKIQIVGTYFTGRARYEEGSIQFEQLVDVSPTAARQVALNMAELGRMNEALDAAWQAVSPEDGPQTSLINHGVLVYLLAVAGRNEEAFVELQNARRRLTETLDKDGPAWRQTELYLFWGEGVARLGQEDHEGAERAFRRLTATSGWKLKTYRLLGQLLLAQSSIDREDLETAIDLLNDEIFDGQMPEYILGLRNPRLARLYLLTNQPRRAREALAAVERLRTSPASLRFLRDAALVYVDLGDLLRASDLREAISDLHDRYPSLMSHVTLAQVEGEIALAQGNLAMALRSLESLEAVDPSILQSKRKLYHTLDESDRSETALLAWKARRGEMLRFGFPLPRLPDR